MDTVVVSVAEGDALEVRTDVLVLKYAQGLFGVDSAVADRLAKSQHALKSKLPEPGGFLQLATSGVIGAKEVLFVGVEHLYDFGYQSIRDFAHRALAQLSWASPEAESVCFTLHGVNYGLDEIEAFESEVAGIADALSAKEFPRSLKNITIIDIDRGRANRLSSALAKVWTQGTETTAGKPLPKPEGLGSSRLRDVGYLSDTKPIVFVAMPFDKKLDDVFHYGIAGSVNKAGYLCERVDQAFFTGDVMERVRKRINQADLVIADLTTANPNVYLEVGYAWGCNKPTVLLAQDANELKFDVRGQRCLVYNSIKELEELLQRELQNLQAASERPRDTRAMQ